MHLPEAVCIRAATAVYTIPQHIEQQGDNGFWRFLALSRDTDRD